MKENILVIDGNNLLHRSYHGLKQSGLTTIHGDPIWAIHGFFVSLSRLMNITNPKKIIIALDSLNSCSERRKIMPEYKINRLEKSGSLLYEINLLPLVLDACNITHVSINNREADDIIASIAKISIMKDYKCYIFSSDRDMIQIIKDDVYVVDSKYNILDSNKIYDKYGLNPKQYYEMAAIRGEPGDNIKGVAGVGEKSAVNYLKKYGSLESIFNLDPSIIEGDKKINKIISDKEKIVTNLSVSKLYEDLPMLGYFNNSEIVDNLEFEYLRNLGLKKAYQDITQAYNNIKK
jgi:DNA polymerase-1